MLSRALLNAIANCLTAAPGLNTRFLIAAAALKTPTRNGDTAQGVNLTL